ncbi:MAG: Kynurenine 3-monooxygenase [Chlamydiia bacterium]|nr:Kynurenine 3-monooxygenase [Chlamydiia bacterium]
MNVAQNEKPIVIIGAGISGLTLSILMRHFGKKVIVFEKRSPYTPNDEEDVRSFNLTITERGMKSLRSIGVEKEVIDASVSLKSRIIHHPAACVCKSEISEQSYGEEKDDMLYSIPRTTLVNLLYEKARANAKADIVFNQELVEVNKALSTLKLRDTTTYEETEIEYSLLIGADGAYSKVRSYMLLGEIMDFKISYFDWFYKKFVISPQDGKALRMDPNSLHVFPKKGGLVVAIPNQDHSFSSIYCTRISDPSDVKSKRANHEMEQRFLNDFPHLYRLGERVRTTFEESKISGLVTVNISQWTVEGNVVLVGDAAHAVFPFYGQGMNSALQDCRQLVASLEKCEYISDAINEYEIAQKASTSALSALCTKHFHYLQEGCTSPLNDSRRFVNKFLSKFNKDLWKSEYHMVAQTEIPYDMVVRILNKQKRYRKLFSIFVLDYLVAGLIVVKKRLQKPFKRRKPVNHELNLELGSI